MRKALWLGVALCLGGCPFFQGLLPHKHYSDDTGLVGVAVPEGSLAGTWGVVISWATVVTIPLIGDRNAGSIGLRVFTRTWDAGSHTYQEHFKWCTDDFFEVEGTTTHFSEDTISKLGEVSFESTADHLSGHYESRVVVNSWGVHNLPDPANTPLPTKDNYQDPPNSDYMLDEDQDGHPGVTANLTGSLTATVYVCSRNIYTIDGAILSEDHVQGLARSQRSEQHTVDGSNRFVVGESKTRADPDPTQSWFDMMRMPEGSTCADLVAAYNDGKLPHSRPFPN